MSSHGSRPPFGRHGGSVGCLRPARQPCTAPPQARLRRPAPPPCVPRSERNINEVFVMYSHTFPHLSERFFKGATWPPVEAVLHLVDGDHVFGLLYKEMYYR